MRTEGELARFVVVLYRYESLRPTVRTLFGVHSEPFSTLLALVSGVLRCSAIHILFELLGASSELSEHLSHRFRDGAECDNCSPTMDVALELANRAEKG